MIVARSVTNVVLGAAFGVLVYYAFAGVHLAAGVAGYLLYVQLIQINQHTGKLA